MAVLTAGLRNPLNGNCVVDSGMIQPLDANSAVHTTSMSITS